MRNDASRVLQRCATDFYIVRNKLLLLTPVSIEMQSRLARLEPISPG
jgi:hypothetical protein